MTLPRSLDQLPAIEDFRGAPGGAYVCEEGWLVIGQEAWTLHEWRHFSGKRPTHSERPVAAPARAKSKHGRRYSTDEERREARRRTKRESMRRRRAGL